MDEEINNLTNKLNQLKDQIKLVESGTSDVTLLVPLNVRSYLSSEYSFEL